MDGYYQYCHKYEDNTAEIGLKIWITFMMVRKDSNRAYQCKVRMDYLHLVTADIWCGSKYVDWFKYKP